MGIMRKAAQRIAGAGEMRLSPHRLSLIACQVLAAPLVGVIRCLVCECRVCNPRTSNLHRYLAFLTWPSYKCGFRSGRGGWAWR